MVFVLEERYARVIFKKYRKNVVAFGLNGSKGINDEDLKIPYQRLACMPDLDDINGVVSGQLKGKKIIKEALKGLLKPSMDSAEIGISMAQLVNIISPERRGAKKEKKYRKNGPNVLVFVLEDNLSKKDRKAGGAEAKAHAKMISRKNKFLTQYIGALFGAFGVHIITDAKVMKKIFDAKKKKVPGRVAGFMQDNDEVRIDDNGQNLKRILFAYYAVEINQSSLSGLQGANIQLSPKSAENLAMALVKIYTNNNLAALRYLKKKDLKKMAKRFKKKNKEAVEAYESFKDLIEAVLPDEKLPKVKFGYSKKERNKDNGKPKMGVKKFMKYFTKRSKKKGTNWAMLVMLYAHTAALATGNAVGDSAYNKQLSTTIGRLELPDGFSKAFVSAAKAYGKGE